MNIRGNAYQAHRGRLRLGRRLDDAVREAAATTHMESVDRGLHGEKYDSWRWTVQLVESVIIVTYFCDVRKFV